MKIYFSRNTHDEKDGYRGDDYFGMIDTSKWMREHTLHGTPLPPESEYEKAYEHNRQYQDKEIPFGVHVWYGSGERYKLTFDEIYSRVIEMYIGGAAEPQRSMPNDERHTVEAFLKGLAFMVEKKLVTVQIVDDGIKSPKFEMPL